MVVGVDRITTEGYSHGVAFVDVKFHLPQVEPFMSLSRSSWSARLSAVLEIDLLMRKSSAKRWSLDVIPVGRSLMNVRKSNGLRTVTWGTPEGTGTQSDDFPSTTTRWDRHVINVLIHFSNVPRIT